MANPDYGVNVHQINSGRGDSAIHLQLQLSGTIPGSSPATDVTVGKPWVLKAVLIDGGMNEKEAPSNLWYAIQEMPGKYMFNTDATLNKCKFDAVIITHWDQDHWTGLFEKAIPYDLEFLQKGTADRGLRQVSFFKYGTPTGRTIPQTTLYAPTWNDTGEATSKQVISGAPKPMLGLSKDPMATGSSKYYMSYEVGANSTTSTPAYTYTKVCLWESGSILGAEFFSGTLLGNTILPSSITAVSGANGLLTKHSYLGQKPGMFCLASMQKVLGAGTGTSTGGGTGGGTGFSADSISRPTNVKQLAGNGSIHVVADLIPVSASSGSATNRSSIATAIIFADGHISW